VPTADEYRRLAAECLGLTPRISPDLQALFVALAEGWVNLADFLDEDHRVLPNAPPIADDNTSNGHAEEIDEDWAE